jgi:hypothetical protein
MRIVAARTRHGVARLLLALALRKGLYLADRAKSRTRSVDEEKVPNVVGERVAGLEFVSMTSWAFNGRLAFQMALHADVIAPLRRQLGRIDDRTAIDVRTSGTMAALASHAIVSERRLGIAVVRALRGSLHSTHTATQAAGVSGKV